MAMIYFFTPSKIEPLKDKNVFKNSFQIAKNLTLKDAGHCIKTIFYREKNSYKLAIEFRDLTYYHSLRVKHEA